MSRPHEVQGMTVSEGHFEVGDDGEVIRGVAVTRAYEAVEVDDEERE